MDIQLDLAWQGGMKGGGLIEGEGLSTKISIPAVYGGAGVDSNPKALYVASTAACFISTLTAIAENKKLPLQALSVRTEAREADGHFAIHHIANVVLNSDAPEEDADRARDYVASADKVCAVGNLARKAGVDVSATARITRA